MELVSFSASNFRSVTSAYKLPIRRPTVLIGPNNEGKSNILRALVSSLQFLGSLGGVRLSNGRIASVIRPKEIYDWPRDFPVSLQEKTPDAETVFDLEFRLSAAEVEEFREEVKSSLNGTLPIQLRFGPGGIKTHRDQTGKRWPRVNKEGTGSRTVCC